MDIARFLAIIGMIAAHLVPITGMLPGASDFDKRASEITDMLTAGIAAPLFAVLGGVSVVFATRRYLRDERIGAAIGATVLRGAILILIGLLLGMIETPVVVVLAYYGLAMILVAPLVAARSWVLATIAAALGLAGGTLNAAARGALEIVNEGGSVTFETFSIDPAEGIRALVLTGEYPAITWVVYLLIGMLVGRWFVAATRRGTLGRAAGTLLAIGATVAALAQLASNAVIANLPNLGIPLFDEFPAELLPKLFTQSAMGAPFAPEWWAQLLAVPHSGSPLDILRTAGIAVGVIGLLVLLCDVVGGRARVASGSHGPGRILDTVRAAGAAPLTIYTLHIVATGILLEPALADPAVWDNGFAWWVAGLGALALQIGGALVIGAILSATGRRGPLEALLSGTVKLAVRG